MLGSLQRMPMNFAPTGAVTPVPAEAFLTPAQRSAQAQSVPATPPTAAGGAPATSGDSANIQSIMQGLGIGGGGGGGLMSSIMKVLGMSGGVPMG